MRFKMWNPLQGAVLATCLLPAITGPSYTAHADEPALPAAYRVVSREGWTVRVDQRLYAQEHQELGERAVNMLAARLADIAMVVPADRLHQLRGYTIVLDLAHGELRSMQYHPSARWLESHGYSRELARCVHIPVAQQFVQSRQVNEQPWAVLHELAHAFHDQELGFDDAEIQQAFQAYRQSGRGDQTLLYNGQKARHYALTDQKEFFAEMSESYLGSNDFFPFNGAELKTAEPEIYRLLRKIWGPIRRTR